MFSIYRTFSKILLILLFTFSWISIKSQVNAGNDSITCDGTANLRAIPAGGYWTTTSGASIVSPSSQNTVVNNLNSGTNQFIYHVTGIGSDVVIITNNQVFADAGTDRPSSCQSTVILAGNSVPMGGSGIWETVDYNPGVIISNSNSSSTNVSNLPFGNTIFRWTVSANGCNASDEVIINNNTPANNMGNDQSGCTNVFYLEGNHPPTGGTGLWTVAPGSPVTPVFNDASNPGVNITVPIGTSIVRWTLTYSGCSSSRDITLVNQLTNPDSGPDQNVCRDTVLLMAAAPGTGESGIWTVENYQGELISNVTLYNTDVTGLKQGTSTFKWTLTNAFCSASDYIQVVNNRPSVNAGADNTICENTYMLSADNASPNTGTWTCSDPSVTFNNIHSNQATASNLLNNIYTFRWTVSNGICTASDDVIITTDFVQINAGNDQPGCADTLILSGSPIPLGGSGYWTVTLGAGSIDDVLSNQTTARNLEELNRFRWTINSGTCTFTDDLEYINYSAEIAQTQSDKAVCTNHTLISANPPVNANESGIWSIESAPGSIYFEDPSLFQTQVFNLNPGLNTLRWTIYNQNCSNYDILNITNNTITADAGLDQTICSTTVNLNATLQGGTGYWTSTTPGIIFSNSTSPSVTASNLAFGPNSFTWTRNDLGCSASDEVIVTNNLPDNVFAGNDQVVCENLAHLTANNPTHGSGTWSIVQGTGTFVNPNLYQTDVLGISTGTSRFAWTVTYETCQASDEVIITNNKFNVSAGSDQFVCNQTSLVLSGTPPSAGQSGNWTVAGGTGIFSNSTLYNSTVSGITKGINTYNWTVTDGTCSSSAFVTITNNTPDSARVGNDQTICSPGTTINAISVTNGVGSWSTVSGGGNIQFPNQYNTAVTSIPLGLNTYRWTVTKNGCSLYDEIVVNNQMVTANIPLTEMFICTPSHTALLVATQPFEPGATGIWTKLSAGTGTIENPTLFSTNVSGLGNGETRFRWTVSNGSCNSTDEIAVINDFYTASAAPVGSSDLCVNYGPVLGSVPPVSGTGLWTSGSSGVSFVNASMSATTVQNLPLGTSTIYWTVTNNGCSAQASFNVTNNFISTNAGKDTTGCESTALMDAQILETGQTGYWTSSYAGITFSNSTDPKTSVSNIPPGTSLLTWTITANGCTASDNLLVTNFSFSVSAGNDRTICGTSHTLTGSDPLAGGSGYWSVIAGNGNIASPTSYTTNVTNLGNGENTFRWNVNRNGCNASDDVSIVNDLYIAQATAPAEVCVDQVTVTATEPPLGSGASGNWTTLLGGGIFDNPVSAVTNVNGLWLGLNRFRWTISKGSCTSYVNVDVYDNRVIVSAGPDQFTCVYTSNLFGTPPNSTGSGIWTSQSPNVVISDPTNPSTEVHNLNRGPNLFTWTITDKGCIGNSSLIVTNNDFDVDAGTDQVVTDDFTNLNAQLPYLGATGQWSILNGFGIFYSEPDPATEVNNLGYGINTYRWTVNWNGCIAYDDVNITYNVAESYAGQDKETCLSYTNLEADLPLMGTGSWSVVSGTGTFENPASNITLVTNISPGDNIYRWTVNAYGILAFDDVNIRNNFFTTFAGNDQQSCDIEIYMNALQPEIGGTGYWQVIQGSGVFDNISDPLTKVTGLMTGNNRYVWTVHKDGCIAQDTVYINHFQPATTANAGQDAVVCNTNSYILSGNIPTSGTGNWTSEDAGISFLAPGQFNSLVSNLKDGHNTLWWTISNSNCQSTDNVVISAMKTTILLTQPESQNLDEKNPLTLFVETNGYVESYQWQKDGIDLANDTRIAGADSSILVISSLTMSDAGNYRCVVKGYCNTEYSGIATVSVISGFETIEDSNVKVYPNPGKGIVYLEFGNSFLERNISVLNLNGEKILGITSSHETEVLDLTFLSDGIYFINIRSGQGIIQRKIIIQK
ncbi:MAG: T9SS type A sorting domain-containing protein [Bacteroidales bacterium]